MCIKSCFDVMEDLTIMIQKVKKIYKYLHKQLSDFIHVLDYI